MGDDVENDNSGNGSPWSRDVPIPSAPIEFSWKSNDAESEPGPPGPDRGDDAGRPPGVDEPRGDGARPTDVAVATPRRSIIVAAAVAFIVALAVIVNVARDDPTDIETAAPGTAVDSLPVRTSAVPPTEPAQPAEAEVDEPLIVTGQDSGQASSDGTMVPIADEWITGRLMVPSRLGSMSDPMTIVVLTHDGVLHEVDLPSGNVVSIEIPEFEFSEQLTVGATTTLLTNLEPSGRGTWLVRRNEPPIRVDIDTRGEIDLGGDWQARPGTDEYIGVSYDGSDIYAERLVQADGSVVSLEADVNGAPPWQRLYSPNGDVLVTDAGGVYEIGDDGSSRRVAEGVLVASSSHHLLVRECDESYECRFVRIDASTDARMDVLLGANFNPVFAGSTTQVSPDGQFARYVVYGSDRPTEMLVDLGTGEETELSILANFNRSSKVWAADSSGIFRRGVLRGMQFVDRTTGEMTAFGEELGQVQEFSVRLGSASDRAPDVAVPSTGLRVVGLGRDGNIHQIDIDASTIVSTDAPPLASGAPAFVFPDATGVTIASFDNVPSIRLDYQSGVARFADTSGPLGVLIPGSRPGSVWQPRAQPSDETSMVFDLVDVSGETLGSTVAFDSATATMLGSDGQGKILVASVLDGVFSLGIDEAERLTTGQIIAIGPTFTYVRECDLRFLCGVFRVDRATSGRVHLEIPAFDVAGANQAAADPVGQTVSPDGQVALIRADGFGTSWTIVDTAAGSALPVPGVAVASPLVWTADSQYALYLSGDVLRLYDRAAGVLRTLDELPEFKAFAAVTDPGALTSPDDETTATRLLVEGPARMPY